MTANKTGSSGDEEFHRIPNIAEREEFEKTGK
jgi:hypothetical protein